MRSKPLIQFISKEKRKGKGCPLLVQQVQGQLLGVLARPGLWCPPDRHAARLPLTPSHCRPHRSVCSAPFSTWLFDSNFLFATFGVLFGQKSKTLENTDLLSWRTMERTQLYLLVKCVVVSKEIFSQIKVPLSKYIYTLLFLLLCFLSRERILNVHRDGFVNYCTSIL